MAFKKTKQEALDLLQEKEKRLAELTEESAYAVQMVQNTIDNLQAVNSDIQTTMDEIDTYMQRLNDTRICIIPFCRRKEPFFRPRIASRKLIKL